MVHKIEDLKENFPKAEWEKFLNLVLGGYLITVARSGGYPSIRFSDYKYGYKAEFKKEILLFCQDHVGESKYLWSAHSICFSKEEDCNAVKAYILMIER